MRACSYTSSRFVLFGSSFTKVDKAVPENSGYISTSPDFNASNTNAVFPRPGLIVRVNLYLVQ